MAWLVDNMQWILLGSGLLTFSMIQAVFAPRATMRAYFGETVESPASVLITRNWGALIAAGGLLLIYVAFYPEARSVALVFVGAGKLVFIALVLSKGQAFLRKQAGLAVVLDSLMVALFAAYLLATR
ncbi:MAG: hypothetical protein Q8R02_22785 [Hyphomonadaceae bacterium]|nr:hypothetical protein [Hyphomonadaceae bacterium]